MYSTTRTTALAGAGFLSAALLTTGLVTGSPPSSAAGPTCHGEPATVVETQRQADRASTSGDDVVLLRSGVTYDGGPGDDTICVGREVRPRSTPFIVGGPGDDWIRGGRWHDYIAGGMGDDRIEGRGGPDALTGDAPYGDNRSDGADRVLGGRGNDSIEGQVTGSADALKGGPGVDTLKDEYRSPGLHLHLGRGVMRSRSGGAIDRVAGFEQHWGSRQGDTIIGTKARDRIDSLGGADTIDTGRGRDHITSARGWVHSGPGNDWVSDGSADGTGGLNAYLGAGDDVAYSWSNGGKVVGQRGNDTIRIGLVGQRTRMYFNGGPGRDTLTWSNCAARLDARAERFRCGGKRIRAWVHKIERFAAGVCADYYSSCGSQRYRDVLRGSKRAEVFRGAAGDDRIAGRRGRDRLVGGNGRDVGWGGPGRDRCHLIEVRHSCR